MIPTGLKIGTWNSKEQLLGGKGERAGRASLIPIQYIWGEQAVNTG